ncbi:MAG: RNA methyltransferase [Cytophagales bacterium]
MISKNEAKFVKSLQNKKSRDEHQLFIVEGGKNVLELLNSGFETQKIYITTEFYEKKSELLSKTKSPIAFVNEEFLVSNGSFSSNNTALALVKMKHFKPEILNVSKNLLILDQIKDPGNLGTIIRTADWFGVNQILCSEDSTDCFSPKVTNSTMGSLGRVILVYANLSEVLQKNGWTNIYGAVLGGEPIAKIKTQEPFALVIGNESKGISEKIQSFCSQKVTIPNIGKNAESLNASVACGILLHELTK